MPLKLIVLNGPPRCGKDTAQALLPGRKEKLSLPLKHGTRGIFDPLEMLGSDTLEKAKDQQLQTLLDSSYRQEQIELFKYLSMRFGESVLGRLMVNRLKPLERYIETNFGSLVTVSDGGRRPEYFPLLEMVGKENMLLVQIHREGTSFTDNRQWVDLSDVGVKTIIVENNRSVPEFERALVSQIDEVKPGWLHRLL